jgi:RNA polymerase-binding transcription factor DksA
MRRSFTSHTLPIPIERLEALPYAATLVDEQPLELD